MSCDVIYSHTFVDSFFLLSSTGITNVSLFSFSSNIVCSQVTFSLAMWKRNGWMLPMT